MSRNIAEQMWPNSQEKNERVPVETEPKYSPAVLTGNWFESRQKYKPVNLHHKTVYSIDFCEPYPPHTFDRTFLEERKLQHEGFMGKMYLHDGELYKNNHTTTYDLTFTHLPRGLDGPPKRVFNKVLKDWSPQQDLLKCYGNATQFGLREYKEDVKRLREATERLLSTEYREEYSAALPDPPRRVPRAAVNRKYSSAMYNVNTLNRDLKMRGTPMSLVPDIVPQTLYKPKFYY